MQDKHSFMWVFKNIVTDKIHFMRIIIMIRWCSDNNNYDEDGVAMMIIIMMKMIMKMVWQ